MAADTVSPCHDEPASKRVCVDDDSFSLTFDCTAALRTLVNVVAELLTRAEFKVTARADQPAEGTITVESIDPKQVCLVVAHLSCRLTHHSGEPRFTVNTADFAQCLKSVPHHYAVDLAIGKASMLSMFAYEALTKTHEMHYDISTLVNDDRSVHMNDLEYDLTLEVDTHTLRRFVRTTKDLHGQEVLFRVQRPRMERGVDWKKHTILTIESEGTTVKIRERFHSITDMRDGSTSVIRTEHEEEVPRYCDEDMEECFQECFGAQYLSWFLKNLDRHTLTMRLSRNKPLVLTYPLGSDDESYVCLVLAARTK
jgi:hypothetical protein